MIKKINKKLIAQIVVLFILLGCMASAFIIVDAGFYKPSFFSSSRGETFFSYNNDKKTLNTLGDDADQKYSVIGIDNIVGNHRKLVTYTGEVPSELAKAEGYPYNRRIGDVPLSEKHYWGNIPEDATTSIELLEKVNEDKIVSLRLYALEHTSGNGVLFNVGNITFVITQGLTRINAWLLGVLIDIKNIDITAVAEALNMDHLVTLFNKVFIKDGNNPSIFLIIALIGFMFAIVGHVIFLVTGKTKKKSLRDVIITALIGFIILGMALSNQSLPLATTLSNLTEDVLVSALPTEDLSINPETGNAKNPIFTTKEKNTGVISSKVVSLNEKSILNQLIMKETLKIQFNLNSFDELDLIEAKEVAVITTALWKNTPLSNYSERAQLALERQGKISRGNYYNSNTFIDSYYEDSNICTNLGYLFWVCNSPADKLTRNYAQYSPSQEDTNLHVFMSILQKLHDSSATSTRVKELTEKMTLGVASPTVGTGALEFIFLAILFLCLILALWQLAIRILFAKAMVTGSILALPVAGLMFISNKDSLVTKAKTLVALCLSFSIQVLIFSIVFDLIIHIMGVIVVSGGTLSIFLAIAFAIILAKLMPMFIGKVEALLAAVDEAIAPGSSAARRNFTRGIQTQLGRFNARNDAKKKKKKVVGKDGKIHEVEVSNKGRGLSKAGHLLENALADPRNRKSVGRVLSEMDAYRKQDDENVKKQLATTKTDGATAEQTAKDNRNEKRKELEKKHNINQKDTTQPNASKPGTKSESTSDETNILNMDPDMIKDEKLQADVTRAQKVHSGLETIGEELTKTNDALEFAEEEHKKYLYMQELSLKDRTHQFTEEEIEWFNDYIERDGEKHLDELQRKKLALLSERNKLRNEFNDTNFSEMMRSINKEIDAEVDATSITEFLEARKLKLDEAEEVLKGMKKKENKQVYRAQLEEIAKLKKSIALLENDDITGIQTQSLTEVEKLQAFDNENMLTIEEKARLSVLLLSEEKAKLDKETRAKQARVSRDNMRRPKTATEEESEKLDNATAARIAKHDKRHGNRTLVEDKNEDEASKDNSSDKKSIKGDVNTEDSDNKDELFDEAAKFAIEEGKVSASMIQRKFRIGYNRASDIINKMETEGIIGPAEIGKPNRQVLATSYDSDKSKDDNKSSVLTFKKTEEGKQEDNTLDKERITSKDILGAGKERSKKVQEELKGTQPKASQDSEDNVTGDTSSKNIGFDSANINVNNKEDSRNTDVKDDKKEDVSKKSEVALNNKVESEYQSEEKNRDDKYDSKASTLDISTTKDEKGVTAKDTASKVDNTKIKGIKDGLNNQVDHITSDENSGHSESFQLNGQKDESKNPTRSFKIGESIKESPSVVTISDNTPKEAVEKSIGTQERVHTSKEGIIADESKITSDKVRKAVTDRIIVDATTTGDLGGQQDSSINNNVTPIETAEGYNAQRKTVITDKLQKSSESNDQKTSVTGDESKVTFDKNMNQSGKTISSMNTSSDASIPYNYADNNESISINNNTTPEGSAERREGTQRRINTSSNEMSEQNNISKQEDKIYKTNKDFHANADSENDGEIRREEKRNDVNRNVPPNYKDNEGVEVGRQGKTHENNKEFNQGQSSIYKDNNVTPSSSQQDITTQESPSIIKETVYVSAPESSGQVYQKPVNESNIAKGQINSKAGNIDNEYANRIKDSEIDALKARVAELESAPKSSEKIVEKVVYVKDDSTNSQLGRTISESGGRMEDSNSGIKRQEAAEKGKVEERVIEKVIEKEKEIKESANANTAIPKNQGEKASTTVVSDERKVKSKVEEFGDKHIDNSKKEKIKTDEGSKDLQNYSSKVIDDKKTDKLRDGKNIKASTKKEEGSKVSAGGGTVTKEDLSSLSGARKGEAKAVKKNNGEGTKKDVASSAEKSNETSTNKKGFKIGKKE